MPFSIQTNVNSLIAQENLRVNGNFQSQTIRRLTSGYRINQSGDDAAGLAVANKFRSDTAELTQGVRNANDGVAQLQIMDGGMSNISKMLDRLKTLAAQSGSATFTGDRTVLNNEFNTLVGEIDRQAQGIGLNTGGGFAKSLAVYLGGGTGATNAALITNGTISMDLSKATVDSASLGLNGMQTGKTNFDLSTAEIALIKGAGNSVANTGYARFIVYGPGFGDGINIDVATSSVTDGTTLATAANAALTAAGVSNTALAAAGITASVVKDATTGNQVLQFNSASTAFQVRAGDQLGNALLGNATASTGVGSTLTSTLLGVAEGGNFTGATTLTLTVEGGGLTAPVTFTAAVAAGTAAAAATAVMGIVNARADMIAAGIQATTAGSTLNFASSVGGALKVSIAGDQLNSLGYGNFTGVESSTVTAAATVASDVLTANGSLYLDLSVGGGPTTRLTVALLVASDNNIAGYVSKTNAAIAAATGSAWQKAGIIAQNDGTGKLQLISTNGTLFRVGVGNSVGTVNTGGFWNGAAINAINQYAGPGTAASAAFTYQDANGEYQLGASGVAAPLTFSAITYGSDAQALTLSADAGGTNHSLVISLNQTNAKDIDQAIKSINTQIQATTDATLKSIAAVKINSPTGTEKIEFVSSVQNFSLNVGSTTTGTGITVPSGGTVSSTKVGTGGSLDISTSGGASTAITAITAAVRSLGAAQAAVGKSQNQLGYAIGLAQSQISSFSSAESQLRDADIAAEAANLTKASVLQQATMAAMAQANTAPQAVLALLRA